MQKFFARKFVSAIGDNLVGIHIRLRSAARLPYDKREMIVEFARYNLVASLRYDFEFVFGKFAEIIICYGGGFFENTERVSYFSRHNLSADSEILMTSFGLRSPVLVGGNFNLAHGIFFYAVFHLMPPFYLLRSSCEIISLRTFALL